MNVQKEVAACLGQQAAGKNHLRSKPYRKSETLSTKNLRNQKIEQRKSAMPRSYRAVYEKAVRGRSLRAAINSFCLECVYWQIEEIRNCADLGCPLFSLRPYQGIAQKVRKDRSTRARGTKSVTGRLW